MHFDSIYDIINIWRIRLVNYSYIATAIVLRDLNCTSIETLDDRILLQKKVYLAQDIGVPLHYGYSWYIHGPYSTDLTAVAYQVIPEGFDDLENKTLKESYKVKLKKINDLDVEKSSAHLNSVHWYELLASIAYWVNHGYNREADVVTKMHETKPQFNEQQVKLGYKSYCSLKQVS